MVGNTEHMKATYYFPNFNTLTFRVRGCPYENAKKTEIIINKRGYACASPVSLAKAGPLKHNSIKLQHRDQGTLLKWV